MRVVFTGGGTAGHVLPNIAVISELRARASNSVPNSDSDLKILYVGSKKGPEGDLCEKYDVPFVGVATGKLRRYFSWENFIDPFRVVAGCFDAWKILRKFRPDVVFSKGGFVSVPVVFAAARLGIPVVVHEADVEPGLANRICARFAQAVYVSWEATMKMLEKNGMGKMGTKTESQKFSEFLLFTGMPVRREILSGVRERGLEFLGFSGGKPVLLVMGGSLGAASVNRLVWSQLDELVKIFDVVHVAGKDAFDDHGKLKFELEIREGAAEELKKKVVDVMAKTRQHYRVFPYLQDELFDVYACADVVVSRAGASAIAELCVLGKPSVLIPLGASQSRGDQIVNAEILSLAGAAKVYLSDWNEPSRFTDMVCELGKDARRRASLSDAMKPFGERHKRAAGQIAEVILSVLSDR